MGVRSVAEARKDDDEYFPLDKEYAISFEKALSFVTPCLDDFDEYIRKEAKDLALPVYEEENSCDMFGENDFETFCDDNAPFHNDVLLFQMDSEGKIGWGDMGIANFFISLSDLKAHDFTNVLCNWDCY